MSNFEPDFSRISLQEIVDDYEKFEEHITNFAYLIAFEAASGSSSHTAEKHQFTVDGAAYYVAHECKAAERAYTFSLTPVEYTKSERILLVETIACAGRYRTIAVRAHKKVQARGKKALRELKRFFERAYGQLESAFLVQYARHQNGLLEGVDARLRWLIGAHLVSIPDDKLNCTITIMKSGRYTDHVSFESMKRIIDRLKQNAEFKYSPLEAAIVLHSQDCVDSFLKRQALTNEKFRIISFDSLSISGDNALLHGMEAAAYDTKNLAVMELANAGGLSLQLNCAAEIKGVLEPIVLKERKAFEALFKENVESYSKGRNALRASAAARQRDKKAMAQAAVEFARKVFVDLAKDILLPHAPPS